MRLINFLKDRGLYLFVSFVFSISLFSYVASTNQGSQGNQTQDQFNSSEFISPLTSQRKAKLNLPLQIDVDNLKYFVTGAPQSVTVQLIGPNALVTAAVNTKNFEVYADLHNLSLGNHTVRLKIRGLSKDITAQIIPAKISINLAQRATRNLSVKVQFNDDNVAQGYDIGTPTSSIQNIQVTGAVNQVTRVNRVVAQLGIPNNTKQTITQRVQLQALDVNGNLLDVVMSPQITTVTLPISPGQGKKTVAVVLKAVGSNISNYALTANVNEVTIYGKQKVLDGIKSVTVAINTNGVNTETTRKVTIDKIEGVNKFNPGTVDVTIQPNKNNGNSKSSATSSTTSSTVDSTSSATSSSSNTDDSTEQNNK